MPPSFKGGIHPEYNKEMASGRAIAPMDPPEEVVLPLSQHIGAPAKAVVEKGDEVLIGQVVAEPGGFVSSPIHATVAGKVSAIEPRPHPLGKSLDAIVIENSGEDKWADADSWGDSWKEKSIDEIKERIKNAGMVGMGGATFPTHVKLSPPEGKPIDTVILNGAECEPYLTADHRLMLEHPEPVVEGLEIISKVLGSKRKIIAIEENKPDALEKMRQACSGTETEVVQLPVKYPQGAEKQLIKALLDRDVPAGGLPFEVNTLVQNVGTSAAICAAVREGRPLVDRVVTITGPGITTPSNLRVTLGTPIQKVIDACGGWKGDPGKLVAGGPMMGFAQLSTETPVIKGTSGLLLFSLDDVHIREEDKCIRCGTCVRHCPMTLAPSEIAKSAQKKLWDRADEYHALDCIECGCCSYGCPAAIPLVQYIRQSKAEIMALRRREGKK